MKNKFFYLLLIVGIFSRLFLVVKLPIWHDEFYSVWASDHTVFQIAHSLTDQVHPPGFYLLLHYWGQVSQHIYWLRFLSVVAFTINIFLIRKLASKLNNINEPNLLVFLYVFSGYFVIFDWQIRMYTIVVTLALFSLLTLLDLDNNLTKKNLIGWLKFTVINFLGLYIDYAYVWYFVPCAIFFLSYLSIKRDKKFYFSLYSFVWSGILLAIIAPTALITSKFGINGILWTVNYVSPNFFIPFFLGSHTTLFFSLAFLALFVWGLYSYINLYKFNFPSLLIIFSGIFSIVATLIYSHFFQPLFHVRSLQIVGLMVVVLYYFGIINIPKRYKRYIYSLVIVGVLINFVLVNKTIIESPGRVIIDYFPWRRILNTTNLDGINVVRYKIVRPLPTQMLIKGLEYTLNGNENIGRHPIKLVEFGNPGQVAGCEKFYDRLLELYKCP